MSGRRGRSTRAVHAGLPPAADGQPFLPGPTFAAPYHLTGDASPAGYARYVNPTWTAWEAALTEVEEGRPVALCRCGQSKTKPFCDATHKEARFESCVRAARS